MIDAATRARRISLLREQMAAAGVHAVAIAPTDNLRYLLGFSPKPDERACLLVVSADSAAMVMPSLNAEQTAAEVPELTLTRWSDEAGPVEALSAALEATGTTGPAAAAAAAAAAAGAAAAGAAAADADAAADAITVAVDPEMRADHLLLLQAALPGAAMVDATGVIGPLRVVKDATELLALQLASDVADLAMLAAFAALAPEVSELAVGATIAEVFRAHSSPAEFAIVAGGANGAFPHHHTGSRPLRSGDAVVIDIGGRREGYVSDITRMAFIGEPSERYREVHAIVEAAVVAGLAASRPGATCADVDAAARGVITDAGFGEYFVHRTGHGLGLSGHEPPWMMPGSDVELAPGMVRSIEPGIYLPGEFGVRLEEIVHVTDDGCERFSSLPRDVHIVR